MEIIYEEFKEALSKIKVLRENANIIEETVQRSVREIIRHVREGKDEALSFYTKKFDGVEMKNFRVSEEEIQQASMFCREFILEALKEAKKTLFRITKSKRRLNIRL